MDDRGQKKKRVQKDLFSIRLSDKERTELKRRAAALNMPLGRYLKRAGLKNDFEKLKAAYEYHQNKVAALNEIRQLAATFMRELNALPEDSKQRRSILKQTIERLINYVYMQL